MGYAEASVKYMHNTAGNAARQTGRFAGKHLRTTSLLTSGYCTHNCLLYGIKSEVTGIANQEVQTETLRVLCRTHPLQGHV
jgi:hypothetical protein